MIKDFNILATTSRGNERDAACELDHLLRKAGDSDPDISRTGVSGLIVARTNLLPLEAIQKLRGILHEYPYKVRYLLRVVPISKVVNTDLAEIAKASENLSSEIWETETFRVTVEKRFTTLHSKDIIEAIASGVNQKVNLSEPDKIIVAEVIGRFTGISVLRPKDVISVMKEKMLQ